MIKTNRIETRVTHQWSVSYCSVRINSKETMVLKYPLLFWTKNPIIFISSYHIIKKLINTVLFIIIFSFINKPIWTMVSSEFYLFYFKILDIIDLMILNFWLFSELTILEWFSIWHIKHARIPARTYFQRNKFCKYTFSRPLFNILSHYNSYFT